MNFCGFISFSKIFFLFLSEKPFIKFIVDLIPFFLILFLSIAFFNLITLLIPLFYPIAIHFFISFYFSGFNYGYCFFNSCLRYRVLFGWLLLLILDYELIGIFYFLLKYFLFLYAYFSFSRSFILNMFSGHMLSFLITNVSFSCL